MSENKFLEIRKKLHLSISDMMRLLGNGVTWASVWGWENNHQLPRVERLMLYKKIAEKYGIEFNIDKIFKEFQFQRVKYIPSTSKNKKTPKK